jgi:hypothetical protein
MRTLGTFALLLAAACGGSAASSETTPAPAASAATTASTANTSSNPCSAGDCTITVQVSDNIATEMQRRQANYKVYPGCPRSFGVTTAGNLRGREAAINSRTAQIAVPGTLPGRMATVAIFFGAEPQRYAVVDFGASKAPKVDFGYRWEGNSLANDLTIVNTNNSANTRCR